MPSSRQPASCCARQPAAHDAGQPAADFAGQPAADDTGQPAADDAGQPAARHTRPHLSRRLAPRAGGECQLALYQVGEAGQRGLERVHCQRHMAAGKVAAADHVAGLVAAVESADLTDDLV